MINNMDGGKIEEHICLLTTVIQMVREVKNGKEELASLQEREPRCDGFFQEGTGKGGLSRDPPEKQSSMNPGKSTL
ncbi:hypothetical protein CDAR_468481 [Caerostris darwini]|uniref:Uncharacterized protein n=1 Tax=Caerostris darwini TaxID=1538125 RepID=A0AAV4Q398_9ARAC|nr:hypothetical protein CDAR_468481 [Caerostris darwini]